MPAVLRFEPIPFGRYQLVERLAVGGMAEIFRAKTFGAHGFEKTLAVKRILPQLAADPEFVDMFINEARLMMRLNHPKVVQVLDFGQVHDQYFIAMEYVSGVDALALLRICARHRRRPTTGIAAHIAADVLDALDYAHKLRDAQGRPLGIVHRDISPSNIFISELGEVKLGDFGIARAHTRRLQTETGALKGKYGYMSPEMVSGADVDHRSDIFSVGVVLAELLMVRRLFMAKSELEVLLQVRDARLDRLDRYGRHVPPALRKILEAALARDPGQRFQDAAAFRDALHHFLFDQKRMIRPVEVRSFLERLQDLERQGETPTLKRVPQPVPPVFDRSAALTPALGAARPGQPDGGPHPDPARLVEAMRRKASLERESEYAAPTRERIEVRQSMPRLPATQGEETPAPPARSGSGGSGARADNGPRRRIALGPPPAAPPIPRALAEAGELLRLDGEEGLTALSELEGSASTRDFKSSESSSGRSGVTPGWRMATPTRPEEMAAGQISAAPLPPPDLSGELCDQSLARVLFGLANDAETGLLVLRRQELVKEIYLVDGDPQFVKSNQTDELFGQYLVRRGVISEGELAMALATLPHFGGKLGDALVSLKLIRPVQVLRHLTHQVRQKLLNAFAWESGSFAFYRGQLCQLEAAPLGLDAFEVIGAGINELSEDVLMRRLQPLLGRGLVSVSPPRGPPPGGRGGGGAGGGVGAGGGGGGAGGGGGGGGAPAAAPAGEIPGGSGAEGDLRPARWEAQPVRAAGSLRRQLEAAKLCSHPSPVAGGRSCLPGRGGLKRCGAAGSRLS
jgi:serine/threonine protein kinase